MKKYWVKVDQKGFEVVSFWVKDPADAQQRCDHYNRLYNLTARVEIEDDKNSEQKD